MFPKLDECNDPLIFLPAYFQPIFYMAVKMQNNFNTIFKT